MHSETKDTRLAVADPKPPSYAQLLSVLNPRKQNFVQHIVAGRTAAEALRLSGFQGRPENAASAAWKYMQDARVIAAIDAGRGELRVRAEYGVDEAMDELDKTIAFARETGNATAMARAVELKAKLCGLMIDRVDQRQVSAFSINIQGIDA